MKLGWLIAYCSVVFYSPTAFAETPEWDQKMQKLAIIVGELLPELMSKNGDPKKIEQGAKSLSELSHDLEKSKKNKLMPPSDADPTVGLIAGELSNQTQRAYLAIRQGNTVYGQNILRGVTAYCIACHSRHGSGPDYPVFPLNPRTEKLNSEEKAELYAATRQFDKAMAEFQKLISDENLMKKKPFEWERPLRYSLALAIRVKQDPDAAQKTVEAALKVKDLPPFEREILLKWMEAIQQWKQEPRKQGAPTQAMQRLWRQAASKRALPLEQTAEVEYLRASAAAHEVLRTSKNPATIAEALFIAGMANEAAPSPSLWSIHELYYEACIRKLPHSRIAENCYFNLEQSIYFGYTGSAGTHIPDDELRKLAELAKLASISTKPQR